jgi:hypothetical protein
MTMSVLYPTQLTKFNRFILKRGSEVALGKSRNEGYTMFKLGGELRYGSRELIKNCTNRKGSVINRICVSNSIHNSGLDRLFG